MLALFYRAGRVVPFFMCSFTSWRSCSPSVERLIIGILSSDFGGLLSAIIPVIAIIGSTVCSSVLLRLASSLAVTIFSTSALFAMRLWNPSMKIMSSFSRFSSSITWSKSSSALSVFLITAISSGEIATTIFDPALAYLHVFVPSLSIVKPSRCMCFIAPIL